MGIALFRLTGAICRDETIASTGGVRPSLGAALDYLDPKPSPYCCRTQRCDASLSWAGAVLALILTIGLAALSTAFQGYEYLEAPFTAADGIYGSTFYVATGLHGFHIMNSGWRSPFRWHKSTFLP